MVAQAQMMERTCFLCSARGEETKKETHTHTHTCRKARLFADTMLVVPLSKKFKEIKTYTSNFFAAVGATASADAETARADSGVAEKE